MHCHGACGFASGTRSVFVQGGGYPDGPRGEQIPLESRIIALEEAFDVMTSEKSYKEAIPVAEALARLVAAAGAQFDPAVVEALVKARQESA